MTDVTGWIEEVWAVRTVSGFYLCAEGGGGGAVVADRPAVGPWEKFTVLYSWELHRAAFRAANGQYVCAEGGGGGALVANRPTIGPWETFELGYEWADLDIPRTIIDGSSFYLRAANGQYVCAEGGGGGALVANRREDGPWEYFTLIKSFSAI